MTILLADSDPLALTAAEKILGRSQARDFTAHYERQINEHGVAVKRLVLTGPEQVDGSVRAA